jgi:hypothetical protein
VEINARNRVPSPTFIKRAKRAGVKFTFGTNNSGGNLGRLEYCLDMIQECGLTPSDMFLPDRPREQKREVIRAGLGLNLLIVPTLRVGARLARRFASQIGTRSVHAVRSDAKRRNDRHDRHRSHASRRNDKQRTRRQMTGELFQASPAFEQG